MIICGLAKTRNCTKNVSMVLEEEDKYLCLPLGELFATILLHNLPFLVILG
jgi:hypothetical protein